MRAFVKTRAIALALIIFPATLFAQPDPAGTEPPKSPLLVDKGKLQKLVEEEESILQRHNPFFFAYGDPLTKVQFSFKSPFVRKFPLYFGYTQIMFWALTEESKPFRDLTYNPELFYRWHNKKWGFFESIDLGAWSHNSNGKSEADSRSYNKSYVRINVAHEGRRWVTRYSAELAYLYAFDPTNRDIRDYVGPLSLYVSFLQLFDSWIDKSEITFKASPGGAYANRWDQGGYQLSWAFRLGRHNIVPAFYMQYYHGFAESLLNYNENVDEFRGGIIF